MTINSPQLLNNGGLIAYIFFFLFFAAYLISCSKADHPPLISVDEPPVNSNQPPAIATVDNSNASNKQLPSKKIPIPKVIEFSVQTFFRISAKQDAKNPQLPPFDYGELSFFVSSTKVKKGDSATAVSLQAEFENLTLKIKSVTKAPFLDCDAEKTGSDIEFEKITDQRLLQMKAISERSEDQPFDFLVIYPAVKNAKKINKSDLTKEMLPASVAVEQVETAIDLNDDGRPDLLIGSYCCYDSSQCDCTNNFQIINSKWKYLGGSEPC